jgi:hypothetical protein
MKSTTKTTKPEDANGFLSMLQLLDKGVFIAAAGEAQAEVLKAIRSTNQKGKLTITLDIVPVPKTDGAQVSITPSLKVTTPKQSARAKLFFTDEDGALHRNDPNQMEMGFTVKAPAAEDEAAKARKA